MIELLVLTVCLQGKGCTEAASAYYQQNVPLQQFAARTERQINNEVPAPILTYLAPLAATCLGRRAVFKISSNVSFGIKADEGELLYGRSF